MLCKRLIKMRPCLSSVRFDAHLRIRLALNLKHLHRKLKVHARRRAALRLQDRQHSGRQFALGLEWSPAQDREVRVYECARRAGGAHGKRVAPVASAFDVRLNKMPGGGKGRIHGKQGRLGVKGVEVCGVFQCEMGHGAAVLHGGCCRGSAARLSYKPQPPGRTPISRVGDSESGHLANRFAPAGIPGGEATKDTAANHVSDTCCAAAHASRVIAHHYERMHPRCWAHAKAQQFPPASAHRDRCGNRRSGR